MQTILGLMSGTSCDGIDIALLKTDGHTIGEFGPGMVFTYDDLFSNQLRNLFLEKDYLNILRIEKKLTELHASAVFDFLKKEILDIKNIELIGMHGHTVIHLPKEKISLQIGNPCLLSELTGASVISNFRIRDIARGGEGAPLVPIFHQAIAKKFLLDNVAFLNIGGVSNITYIEGNNIHAFDAGPGSALIDNFVRERCQLSYDNNGEIAAKGKPDERILKSCLSDQFYKKNPPKSLDRNHFNYIDLTNINLEDGAATLTYITAKSIEAGVRLLNKRPNKILICGGGRKNKFLVDIIKQELADIDLCIIDEIGINGDLVEAYAFAYLAARSNLKLPLSYPTTTGTSSPCTGGLISFYK